MLLRCQLVSLSLICMSNDRANELCANSAENVLAGLLAGRQIAALAKPQHHIEETEMRLSVGDRVMLAADRANANATERKNPGFYRGPADDFDDLAHIDARIEVG
jgi:hypothetical protein